MCGRAVSLVVVDAFDVTPDSVLWVVFPTLLVDVAGTWAFSTMNEALIALQNAKVSVMGPGQLSQVMATVSK